MKLISLNTWGGRVREPLGKFIETYKEMVDVFLFQEVFHEATDHTRWEEADNAELFRDISSILQSHVGYFAPVQDGEWGIAAFVRNSISVDTVGDIFVHRKKDSMEGKDGTTLGRNIQYLHITSAEKPYALINFHGLWTGGGKQDTPERLEQSKRILAYIASVQEPVILCGDFNLLPDTESIAMFEKEGKLRNLIAEYGIISTRTPLYKRTKHQYADYAFVSPQVTVHDFKVLPDTVSDHSPLYLEFE